jgi:hypothetical protein
MDALREANSTSLRKKLAGAIPIRRKGSVATTTSTEPVSAINLLDLPVEIVDQILREVGMKNFYDEPSRLAVCKKWYEIVRPTMLRNVELDVNSLLRVIPPPRTSVVRKLLRRNTGEESKLGLQPAEIVRFDADIRVINGFITKNNVPVARNSDYKRWKADIDTSLEWLAAHMHELSKVRNFRLRLWSRDCLVSESRQREWWRLARSAIVDLSRSPAFLDYAELDFCGTAFAWTRCGWKENTGACAAVFGLLPRVRVLRLRVQNMCPSALQGEAGAELPNLPRLEEFILNRDTWEANPWSGSGPRSGSCMRPEAQPGSGNRDLVRAMRKLVAKMDRPKVVRFLFHDNTFERRYSADAALPKNSRGEIAYSGSVAYDLLSDHVERMGFLAEWNAPGRPIAGCAGLFGDDESEGTAESANAN